MTKILIINVIKNSCYYCLGDILVILCLCLGATPKELLVALHSGMPFDSAQEPWGLWGSNLGQLKARKAPCLLFYPSSLYPHYLTETRIG